MDSPITLHDSELANVRCGALADTVQAEAMRLRLVANRKSLPRDLVTQTILGVSKALVMLDDEVKALPEGDGRTWVETNRDRAIRRLRELHIQLDATK